MRDLRPWTVRRICGAEEFEFDFLGDGFEGGAVFGEEGFAFFGELEAVLHGVGKDGDKAAGACEAAVDGPGGEDGGFADLAGPVEDGDAGGVVLEDWDLVGAELNWHALRCAPASEVGKEEILTVCGRRVILLSGNDLQDILTT